MPLPTIPAIIRFSSLGEKRKHSGYIAHDAKDNTPLGNMFVRVLQEIGIETDSFAPVLLF